VQLQAQTALPTGLQSAGAFRFKNGETWKISHFNGFYKTCELLIKYNENQAISIQADSGTIYSLNLFGTTFNSVTKTWTYESDIYVYRDGRMISNFNNQSGGTIQIPRDIIGNSYQFKIEKL
jgi:hypothetical protein